MSVTFLTAPIEVDAAGLAEMLSVVVDERGWEHIGVVAKFADEPGRARFDLPGAGEHTEAVMREVVGDRTVNEVLTVGRQEIGYLPGDLDEKLAPWMAAVHDNLYALFAKAEGSPRDAVEELFDVEVASVNIVNRKGKPTMRYGRVVNHRARIRKAYVKLAPGSRTLEFFEGI